MKYLLMIGVFFMTQRIMAQVERSDFYLGYKGLRLNDTFSNRSSYKLVNSIINNPKMHEFERVEPYLLSPDTIPKKCKIVTNARYIIKKIILQYKNSPATLDYLIRSMPRREGYLMKLGMNYGSDNVDYSEYVYTYPSYQVSIYIHPLIPFAALDKQYENIIVTISLTQRKPVSGLKN